MNVAYTLNTVDRHAVMAEQIYSPAKILHHVKHLKERPDLAYSRYYTDENGVRHRQLLALNVSNRKMCILKQLDFKTTNVIGGDNEEL